jgi:hypothetical protein
VHIYEFRDIGAGYVRTEEPRSSPKHYELLRARRTMAEPVPCGDSGWLKVADPSGSGRFYYCRPDTGETSWELPPGVCVTAEPGNPISWMHAREASVSMFCAEHQL